MRALAALVIALPVAAHAQAAGPPAQPAPPAPATPGYPSGGLWPGVGPQGYGGCYGCSYTGDYYGSSVAARRPAPPMRLQGQWRNGWWYY